MKQTRFAPAPAWLRGALLLSLLAVALPAIPGCSNDAGPMQPEQTMSLVGNSLPLSIAPDFCPSLPAHEIVVRHTAIAETSFFDVWFWGIGSGYDLTDGTWPGWCIEPNIGPTVQDPGRVTVWCSYDEALPGNLSDLPINELNYMVNHKIGGVLEIQAAIHLLNYGSSPNHPPTENSYAMLNDALANGGDFVPGPGELIVIFVYSGDGGIGEDGFQDTIIEMRLPGDDQLGACTPGYWKTHFDRWPAGYDARDDFDSTFGVDLFNPDITLGAATWAKGGGVRKLARHGTAALLNAAHGDVGYPYTVAEVIALVQAGDADTLGGANEEFACPLEGSSADPQAELYRD